jgi:zinc/manganese transport system substrate-binding protein
MRSLLRILTPIVAAGLALSGCGGGDETTASDDSGAPSIVVTTNILGDVVSSIVGDHADVRTIMPVGANPHDFQASAQEAAAIRSADLLVVNGGGFEEGLLDLIEGAEEDGVTVVEAVDFIEALDSEDEHGEEDGVDPHFFTDPAQMIAVVQAVSTAITEEIPDIADAIETAAGDYVADLEELDANIESELSAIPAEKRVLVTNHEVFGYFAERYDFEIVGTVVPGGSTEGGSAKGIAELVETIREHEVPAIFADTSAPDQLAQTLAGEVGNIEVVELFSESLGEAGSGGANYVEMMRTNATRIAQALT